MGRNSDQTIDTTPPTWIIEASLAPSSIIENVRLKAARAGLSQSASTIDSSDGRFLIDQLTQISVGSSRFPTHFLSARQASDSNKIAFLNWKLKG